MSLNNKLKRLKKFILDQAPTCVHEPEGQLPRQYVTPTCAIKAGGDDRHSLPKRSTTGHYLQMYDWDACYFSQAALAAGIKNLALDVVTNFLSLKDSHGYVPRTVSPHRIWDAGDMCKPFLCQALVHAGVSQQGDLEKNPEGRKLLDDLHSYLAYFQEHRLHESGLYHWRNVLESGVDDNLALLAPRQAARDENEAVGDFPDGLLLAADLNSYLVAEYRSFSSLAQAAGKIDLSSIFAESSAKLAEKIESELWSEQLGMYCNIYPDSHQPVSLRSWTGLLPVLLGFASPERIEQAIRKNILAPEHFFRPAGLSSVAASEPLYNQSRRGLYGRVIVSNWQGPMWILPNALAARCLTAHGFSKEAVELASRVTGTMADGLAQTGTLFENYNAESGKPLFAPQFMSWNILALELIDLLE